MDSQRPAIGIMQGRLTAPVAGQPQAFPADTWRREFDDAGRLGFGCIEWLLADGDLDANPLWSPEGVEQIRDAIEATGVRVATVCGDYFRLNPLTGDRSAGGVKLLQKALVQASAVGAAVVLVPFLEESSIGQAEARDRAGEALRRCANAAAENGVSLAVETDLPAPQLVQWLNEIGHSAVGVYYDLGNAVSEGLDPAREIPVLASWLKGVHIKDRTYQGPNVPLGTGGVKFARCLQVLADVGYTGPLVMETIRGDSYLEDAERHRTYLHELLKTVH